MPCEYEVFTRLSSNGLVCEQEGVMLSPYCCSRDWTISVLCKSVGCMSTPRTFRGGVLKFLLQCYDAGRRARPALRSTPVSPISPSGRRGHCATARDSRW